MKVFKAIQRGVESAVAEYGWPCFMVAAVAWAVAVVCLAGGVLALLIGGE